MQKKRIFLSSPHMSGLEQRFIHEAFDSNWIAPLGPNVDQFENELAQYTGAYGAAALSSGTAAIHLALEILNVGEGDKVICSSLTFVASANPILYQKAIPILIDSEPNTWNMSPSALQEALEQASKEEDMPKAIIVVNLYGQSADMDEILRLAKEYGDIPVIEDAAESLGAFYKGKASGTFGKFGIFSFNGNKIITTSGGGALISNDKGALDRVRFLATQARDPAPHYQHHIKGYNYRMSNILAGIGRGQLQVLNDRVAARRRVYQQYKSELSYIDGITFMPEPEGYYSTRWLTALTVDPERVNITRDMIIEELERANIETRPVWKPLHLQPLFKGCKYYNHSGQDVSSDLFNYGVCLPSGSNLERDEQNLIIDLIKNLIKKYNY
ncbi:aminotransferase class I/II-fold pyridoxal phosphate-dependent enzyme [Bacillus tianshenii]|nr:aminotransferase class I/II-fold pyridoxal phosphate-dependent enzyme [Bacillus tianshenii]